MTNKVQILGHYGSDTIIASSAWTSTERDLSPEKIARIPKMINTLWMEGHETPFEKGLVHFLVDTEIASHIHFLKHRISSFNGESGRYKELKEDKFYIPQDWPIEWQIELGAFNEQGNELYHKALTELTPLLGRARAKESARFFKTYSSQIQGDVSFNMRSFANFLRLRNSNKAQKEIREIAQEMLQLVKGIEGNPFEHTLKAIEGRSW